MTAFRYRTISYFVQTNRTIKFPQQFFNLFFEMAKQNHVNANDKHLLMGVYENQIDIFNQDFRSQKIYTPTYT